MAETRTTIVSNGLSNMGKSIFSVNQSPQYAVMTAVVSLSLFLLFIFINNLTLFVSAFKVSNNPAVIFDVYQSAIGILYDIGGPLTFGSTLLVSFLGGLNVSLIVYKLRLLKGLKRNDGILSFGGLIGGTLSSTCAACSTTLISVVGVAGGLTAFPLRGLEISIVSIVVLVVSLYFVSKSIVEHGLCKI